MSPRFWDNAPERPGWQAAVLKPVAALRPVPARHPSGAGIPLIRVDTARAGAPDLPAAAELAMRLAGRQVDVHLLHAAHGPVRRVDPVRGDASRAGAEALLLAAFAPVWTGEPDTALAAAAASGAEAAVLLGAGPGGPDAALSLLVVDARRGFGNALPRPAGPLHAPVEVLRARADAVLAVGSDSARARFRTRWKPQLSGPVLGARLAPLQTGMEWAGLRVLAFAGGDMAPAFLAALEGLGAKVLRRVALDGDSAFTPGLMLRLEKEAEMRGAQLVTTEREAVRLPAAYRPKVLTLPLRLELEDGDRLDALIDGIGLSRA